MYNQLLGFLTPPPSGLTEFDIEGVQSGTLPLGDYTVNGDIVVLDGTALVLTAGSIFRMKDKVLWEIQGKITAAGTTGSHIQFVKHSSATAWHGMRFCEEEVSATDATMSINTTSNILTASFVLNEFWPIRFTTTGTLPAPLEPDQRYYIRADDSLALNMAGDIIDVTDTGSGTHTAHRLNPTDTGIKSASAATEQSTLQYCDFTDVDKSTLDAGAYGGSYRHWLRGGGLMTFEYEDIVFQHLTFTRCKSAQRGGGCYIQGETSATGAINLLDFSFVDCETTAEIGAAFGNSHGADGVDIEDFSFQGSVYAASIGIDLTVDHTLDYVQFDPSTGITLDDNLAIKDVVSTGDIPGGVSADTNYFMVGVSGQAFQLALTPGGAAIDITSNGTGQVSCTAVQDYYFFDSNMTISGTISITD